MSSSESFSIKSIAPQPHIYLFFYVSHLFTLWSRAFTSWTTMKLPLVCVVSGLNPLSFDPATNNDPLQFNGSSGPLVTECPALETSTENAKKRKRATLPPGTGRQAHSYNTSSLCLQPCLILKMPLMYCEHIERARCNFTLMEIVAHHYFLPAGFRGKRISPRALRLWMSVVFGGQTAAAAPPLRWRAVNVCCRDRATCNQTAACPTPQANADPSHCQGNADSVATFMCVCAHTGGP